MLPVPHIPDGLTIALIRRSAGPQGTEAIIPDNGQVERLNRTLKDVTVKRFHYESHDQFRQHLTDFVAAYKLRPSAQGPTRPSAMPGRKDSSGSPMTCTTEPGTEQLAATHRYRFHRLGRLQRPQCLAQELVELRQVVERDVIRLRHGGNQHRPGE